jgi:putative ABC transport system permease protein
MSLGRLVLRQMMSHPIRSALTIGAVTVATFLFCFLFSILTSLSAAVKASATNRILVTSAVSLFQVLPRTYQSTLAGFEGVESVCRFSWFGGVYRDESGFFAQFAAEPEVLVGQYPELILPEEEKQAWYQDRKGAIIGIGLSEKYGWRVGDQIPLIGTIYPKVDGSEWTFNVSGVYRSKSANLDEVSMYFHAEYLEEAQEQGEALGPSGPGLFIVRVADGYVGEEVSARIDAYYDAGPQRTRTQTEAAFQAGFLSMLGNLPTFLGMIVGAILVAIFFGVINTMTLAARERTRSVGILKAVGFRDRVPARLYLFEALTLVGIGAVGGIALALATQVPFRRVMGAQVPMYEVSPDTVVQACLLGVVISFVAGLVPALGAARLKPVEALRRV